MAEQLCATCGQTFRGKGFQKDGASYCSESCAAGPGKALPVKKEPAKKPSLRDRMPFGCGG